MLVRHLDVECLSRILDTQLTPEFKFNIALGELQQQQPLTAHLLKMHIEILKGRCPLTCPLKDVLNADELAAALQHPNME